MSKNNLFLNGDTDFDPVYKAIRDSENPCDKKGKQFCIDLWEIFEQFSDDHFVSQIQKDFHARFWEMYLTCTLIEKGYQVTCPKPGPDILLSCNQSSMWIEAIAPTSGDIELKDSVPEITMGSVQNVPNDQVILRYRSAIAVKSEKYKEYVKKGIVNESDQFVIAINGCRVNNSRTDYDPPRIVRAVFPIGDEYITIDKFTGKSLDSGFLFKKSISKSSGSKIPIDIFLDKSHSFLSGVIFSLSDCCNRPEKNGSS